MIRFSENNQIDRIKWNKSIMQSVNSLHYAYDWYLDIVAEGWAALIENDYESVMPLVYRKKAGIYYIFTPIFTQQLGIFSTRLLNNEICNNFINAIPAKFCFIEYNLNSYNQIDNEKFETKSNANHLLDLIDNYENIRKNYSENLKRNLKKAEKYSLNISENIKPEDIIHIFAENKGKEINRFTKEDYQLLKRLIYKGIHNNIAVSMGVYTQHNELCAAAVFFISGQRAVFLFSATNQTAKETFAMPLLIDNFIRKNAESNMILDFEGSNDANLARFYKSFGSKTVTYDTLLINKLPFFIKFPVNLIKKLRKYV